MDGSSDVRTAILIILFSNLTHPDMKRFYIAVLAISFSILGMSLFGQESATQIDSTVTYSFNSPTDSVRSSISLIHRKDSIHLYEATWVGSWNTDSAC